ncbi:hypothetical protein SEA_FIZZLES_73 [Microbacterium phage Fizzles]|nr:hypothetical protein SEA_FIZZLES_73 [Microbacterium phage Fizzles]
MAEPRQAVVVSINAQDLPGMEHELGRGMRKEITPQGMLGVANNTGIVELMINDRVAVRLRILEDHMGHAVVLVDDALLQRTLGKVDIELYDLVAPRRDAQPKRDRRFGGEGLTS